MSKTSRSTGHAGDPLAGDSHACSELRAITRRAFLQQSAAASAGAMSTPLWLPQVAFGGGQRKSRNRNRDILVFIKQFGGIDYLSQLIPFSDSYLYDEPYDPPGSEYYELGLRPTYDGPHIGLLPPTTGDDDDHKHCEDMHFSLAGNLFTTDFGMNKAFKNPNRYNDPQTYRTLFDLWEDNEVAFALLAGTPDLNRSHFSAEWYMESGTPNQPHNEQRGWLARYFDVLGPTTNSLRGAAMTYNKLTPKMMAFAEKTLAFRTLSEVVMPGASGSLAQRIDMLKRRYDAETDEPLRSNVLNTFDIIDALSDVGVNPHPDAHYYTTGSYAYFGQALMNLAAIIKGQVPIDAAVVSATGFDQHKYLGSRLKNPENGLHSGGDQYNLIRMLSHNVSAFRKDCEDFWDNITLVFFTEFGRQINQNDNFGSDHANAGLMIVMGGHVNPGVYCRETLWNPAGDGPGPTGWPGLEPGTLPNFDAFYSTTDYRSVFGEILRKRCGLTAEEVYDYIFKHDNEDPEPIISLGSAAELGIVNE